MKNIILLMTGICFIVQISVYGQVNPQVQANMDSIIQVNSLEHRKLRTQLDSIDNIFLMSIENKNDSIQVITRLYLDSLINIIQKKETVYILAEAIASKIISFGDEQGIRLLLDNMKIFKHDGRPSAPWEQSQSPCLHALLNSNKLLSIYDYILNSNYIDEIEMDESQENKTLLDNLVRLFHGHLLSDKILHYSTLRSPLVHKSEKYYEIIGMIQERLLK